GGRGRGWMGRCTEFLADYCHSSWAPIQVFDVASHDVGGRAKPAMTIKPGLAMTMRTLSLRREAIPGVERIDSSTRLTVMAEARRSTFAIAGTRRETQDERKPFAAAGRYPQMVDRHSARLGHPGELFRQDQPVDRRAAIAAGIRSRCGATRMAVQCVLLVLCDHADSDRPYP